MDVLPLPVGARGRAVAFLAIIVACVACGPSAREKLIGATMTTANAAAAGFVEFDAKHQHDIVVAAKDRAEGEAALAEWRTKQSKVEHAFAAAYKAIAAAALANDDPSVASMMAAASQLTAALHEIGAAP